MSTGEWGYAYMADGSRVPLSPPEDLIPEDEREYLYESPGFTCWTRRPDEQQDAGEVNG